MSKLDLNKYKVDVIDLFGVQNEFKLCHLPFLVYKDVYGALALEGSSGTGKTTIVNRLGVLNKLAGGGDVRFYSADKMRYEDFVGVPIPDMETRKMEIFPMPNALADCETVLVDEINRASYENQEKFLQLFASRKIDSLPVKCKYLYAAMNPVMSDGKNDVYEGVQPLDKALGERMFAIVRMTPFHKLDESDRIKIMQQCFNQVKWEPRDESIELFSEYIKRATTIYEEAKETLSEKVASYVDSIQADLHKESKMSIEARRAQFILVNILALHALNSVDNKASLETSALAALSISFPNALWEQKVSLEALKVAHHKNQSILKIDPAIYKQKSSSKNKLERTVREIEELVEKKASKEVISKTIHQLMPDQKDDKLNFYTYCCAVVEGFSPPRKNAKETQSVLKEQEFARFQKHRDTIFESEAYKELDQLCDHLKNNKSLPKDYEIPSFFLESSGASEGEESYTQYLLLDAGKVLLAIYKFCGIDPASPEEAVDNSQMYVETTRAFKAILLHSNQLAK